MQKFLKITTNRCREEKRSCNTWDRGKCPSPCEEVDCPAFSQCIDTSTDEVPT